VAVKWFVPEELSELADRVAASGSKLLAPKLVLLEAANAFWRKALRNLITAKDAAEYLASLPRYFDSIFDHDDLIASALSLACSSRHRVYDLLYIEAARRHDAVMVTADRALVEALAGSKQSRYVVHLADWSPSNG
jgi:predicted nucleic acid-binding protein